ncbi:hypothetical protein GMOD_00002957 [Pyrenophora seminiperda CCB06]|uniref:Uncharacterized protein n=1 Tax=Pyrenophora seminiperda CCB06 TaxID=1302712 RepID=A0A3M7M3T0_9PLEO|nr:hypothetical protein GMOD_00002957 [Pyrenophora seminiperda CCB06]
MGQPTATPSCGAHAWVCVCQASWQESGNRRSRPWGVYIIIIMQLKADLPYRGSRGTRSAAATPI